MALGNYGAARIGELQLSLLRAGISWGERPRRGRETVPVGKFAHENRVNSALGGKEQLRWRNPDSSTIRLSSRLRLSDFEAYNRHAAGQKVLDFSNTDLRGVDFRGVADIEKLNVQRLVHARRRSARNRFANLGHGRLLAVPREDQRRYFPTNLSPQEISNSIQLGTRMRTSRHRIASSRRALRSLAGPFALRLHLAQDFLPPLPGFVARFAVRIIFVGRLFAGAQEAVAGARVDHRLVGLAGGLHHFFRLRNAWS